MIMTTFKRSHVLSLAILLAAFSLWFAVGMWTGDHTEAETIPGTVNQSAIDTANGISIAATKAVFSASSVDVWLRVSPDGDASGVLAVVPDRAELRGTQANGTLVSNSGVVVLRFPPLPGGPKSTEPLIVPGVRIERDDGTLQRVAGPWQLSLTAPTGSAARDAMRVETLAPAKVVVDEHEIIVEGLRTPASTVIRYQLPPGLSEVRPPTVKALGASLALVRSSPMSRAGSIELWFEPSQFGSSLSVTFEDLRAAPASDQLFEFRATIEPWESPGGESAIRGRQDHGLRWSSTVHPNGYDIQSVVWHRDAFGPTLLVAINGLWDTNMAAKSEVLVNGQALLVRGAVTYPAFGERGDFTTIEAVVSPGLVFRDLLVRASGSTGRVASQEITLTP